MIFPKNVGRSKSFMVELDERDRAQDLTGDSGAVGRVHVDKKGLVFDLKGIYKSRAVVVYLPPSLFS